MKNWIAFAVWGIAISWNISTKNYGDKRDEKKITVGDCIMFV